EEVLESLKVEKIFHEVAQKPGKPMYFGIRGDVIVFGLPGNPFATLNCFIQYVIPAIKQSTGFKVRDLHQHCLLANDFAVKPGLTYFLKGKTDGIHVSILDGQESFMLSSFAESNCLVRLPEGIQNFKTGDFVDVLLLEDIWK
nr:molybdopterin molybdenumtransferase MoeA [Sediminibacterium sp.]